MKSHHRKALSDSYVYLIDRLSEELKKRENPEEGYHRSKTFTPHMLKTLDENSPDIELIDPGTVSTLDSKFSPHVDKRLLARAVRMTDNPERELPSLSELMDKQIEDSPQINSRSISYVSKSSRNSEQRSSDLTWSFPSPNSSVSE